MFRFSLFLQPNSRKLNFKQAGWKKEEDRMRYAIVIEKSPANFAAYVPDLPGCVATGATLLETETLIREAIAFHLEGLQADGQPLPPPSCQVEYVEVSV